MIKEIIKIIISAGRYCIYYPFNLLIISFIITIFWVRGIDNMKNKHPNYKGEDFLDWDDNKNHTENGI